MSWLTKKYSPDVEALKPGLIGFMCSLQLMDAVSTVAFVTEFGVEAEGNPLMRWVMEDFGVGALCLLKAFVVFSWVLIGPRVNVSVQFALCGLYIPVVILNWLVAWS